MSKQCIVVGTRYCSFLHADKLLLPLAEFSPLEISRTELHPENWQNITDGKCGGNRGALDIPVSPHSVVIADRGYCDFSLLDN